MCKLNKIRLPIFLWISIKVVYKKSLFFFLLGIVWPIEGQIPWLRMLSELLPTRIGGRTMNDVALRGWTWDHPSVMYSTAVLFSQLILSILVLFGLDKIKKDMWTIK